MWTERRFREGVHAWRNTQTRDDYFACNHCTLQVPDDPQHGLLIPGLEQMANEHQFGGFPRRPDSCRRTSLRSDGDLLLFSVTTLFFSPRTDDLAWLMQHCPKGENPLALLAKAWSASNRLSIVQDFAATLTGFTAHRECSWQWRTNHPFYIWTIGTPGKVLYRGSREECTETLRSLVHKQHGSVEQWPSLRDRFGTWATR